MLPIVIQGPIFIMQIVMLRWGGGIPLSLRIIGSFIIMAICMVLILVSSELTGQQLGWGFLMFIICVFGAFNGILQLSLYAFTGPMPPTYSAALNQGFGLGGVVICAIRALSLVVLPPSGEPGDKNLLYGAILYFALSVGIVILNVFGMIYALNSKFTLHYLMRVRLQFVESKFVLFLG